MGHRLIIVLAATCTELAQRCVSWDERWNWTKVLERAGGILALIGGLYLICTAD
ncbi:MAG: hypothetical protein ACYSWO_19010 [Planctomycetota bacterium]